MTDLSHDLRISREALEAAEKRAAEAERRFSEEEAKASQAVKFLGRIGEELVNAGLPGGDRDVILGNVRSLVADCAEAERAVAALKDAARDAWSAAGSVVQELQHHRNNGKTPIALAAKIDALERATPATALATPIGSGWLSPEQGAEKDARIVEVTAEIAGRDRALAWAREAITVLSAQVASLGGKLPEIILNPLAAHSTENR